MRARIRTVKPELLCDERLWDLGQSTGLPVLQCFIGLWCFADREGRFEWRPRALKGLVLPYWNGDLGDVLSALEGENFIVKYVVDGKEYGLVRNFQKHQAVNKRESPSTLPPPPIGSEQSDEDDARARTCTHVHNRETHVHDSDESHAQPCGFTEAHVGKGREGKGTIAPATPAHSQTVRDTFAAECTELGVIHPSLSGEPLSRAVDFLRRLAMARDITLEDATRLVCRAAVAAGKTGKSLMWAMSQDDPSLANGRPPQPRPRVNVPEDYV